MDKSVPLPLAWDQILTILFVIFNPLKVVGPFATLTRGTEQAFCKQLAWRAILFAAIGVVIAGILGQRIGQVGAYEMRSYCWQGASFGFW